MPYPGHIGMIEKRANKRLLEAAPKLFHTLQALCFGPADEENMNQAKTLLRQIAGITTHKE